MGKEGEMIKAYKGFDKDLKCRGFQYEVGKEYVTDSAIACTTGFHCCENPFDVFGYYAPCNDNGSMNRFCEVEAGGDIDTSKEDKISCTHLKVKAEIGLNGLIKAGVKFILDKIKWDDDRPSNMGYRSTAANIHSREHGKLLHSREHGRLLHSREHGLPLHSREHGRLLHSREHGKLLHSREHGKLLHSREHGKLLHSDQHRQLFGSKCGR